MKNRQVPIRITWRFNQLVNEIMEYESDTFSASGSKLKRTEAVKIAEAFTLEDMQARIDTDTMDGEMITNVLEEIRE